MTVRGNEMYDKMKTRVKWSKTVEIKCQWKMTLR